MTTLSALSAICEQNRLLVQAPDGDANITGITDDSRSVRSGDIYCAWRGTTRDSHDFVQGAERSGAAAALVERVVDGVSIPQIVVTDGRRAAALAANAVFGNPAEKLVVAGVTGTNGKTTTAWIMRHVLNAR